VELRLLVASLHITNESQKRKMIELLSASDIDWNYFLKLVVERHRLVGSVYKNLMTHATGLVPDSVCESLKQQCQKNAYLMMHKAAELVRLTTLLTEAGYPLKAGQPLKSSVLASLVLRVKS